MGFPSGFWVVADGSGILPALETVRVSPKQLPYFNPPVSVSSGRASFISVYLNAFQFISIFVGLEGAHPIVSAGFPSRMIPGWCCDTGFPHVWKPAIGLSMRTSGYGRRLCPGLPQNRARLRQDQSAVFIGSLLFGFGTGSPRRDLLMQT